jgi:hypothetical protein
MRCRRSIRRVLWGYGAAGAVAATLLLSPHAGVAEGVLVLRNGNVLEGAVTLVGEHYRIENAGASLQVPVEQVETACRNLEEAYELRRRDRAGTSTDAHIELAHWCLRNNMLSQAAREILDVRTIDPGHPQLAVLDLLLRQRLENEAARAAASVKKSDQKAATGEPTPFTPSDLELSTEAQAQFVRSIQPMLIHSCATGGCHQPGSARQLQLDRWALEGKGSATLIRRNLASVAAHINKADPPSSALIQRARQAHGLAGKAPSVPLAPYQAALLLAWLNQAAGIDEAAAANATMPLDGEVDPGAADPESFDAPAVDLNKKPFRRAAHAAFTPRDTFDAEIFNRRHASQGPKMADSRPASMPQLAPAAPPASEQPTEMPASE